MKKLILALATCTAFAMTAHAEVIYSDNFDNGLDAAWTSKSVVWGEQAWSARDNRTGPAGNLAAGTTGQGYSELARSLDTTVTASWEITFDWGWDWGNGSDVYTGVALRTLDQNGWGNNGYVFLITQGDIDGAGRFQILKYTGTDSFGLPGVLLDAGSDGTKDIGWAGGDLVAYKQAKFTWDVQTGALTAYYRLDAASDWQQVAQAVDADFAAFDNIALLTKANGGADAYIDNLTLTTVPEPATLALTAFGSLLLLTRKR